MHSVVSHLSTKMQFHAKYIPVRINAIHNLVDLERKIAAIAQVDSSLNSTSTQEQVMINVWLLYLIKHVVVQQ